MARKAMQALLFDEDEWEEGIGILANDPDLSSGVIKNDLPTWNCDLDEEVWVLAELFQSEMPASGASDEPWAPPYTEGPPYGREDASWEEIIHLISHVGLGCADPERCETKATSLSSAAAEALRAVAASRKLCGDSGLPPHRKQFEPAFLRAAVVRAKYHRLHASGEHLKLA